MDKQTFWAFTIYLVAITGSSILLVTIAPWAGKYVTIALCGLALLGWVFYAIIRKMEGK